MKYRDLFLNGDVAFLPAEENLQRQQSGLEAFASSRGYKIKMNTGIWINPTTTEVERVLRVEFLGLVEIKSYTNTASEIEKERKREKRELRREQLREKHEKILQMYRDGASGHKIAEEIGCSFQNVYQILNKIKD